MDAAGILKDRTPLVERNLERVLLPADVPPRSLHAAMRHLMFPAGKLFRPVLALAGAEAVGAPPETALPLATAVELVHTYSLIHDDLPCMDDDAERRGRPAVHIAYGEAVAVLAGDALLALAFEVLADGPGDAAARLDASRDLARVAGSQELVGGQVDDLEFDTAAASLVSVESIHQRKSAALIETSIVGGARLGGATADQIETLRRFGRSTGVAFQIADDLLDAHEDDPCSYLRFATPAQARERAESLLGDALVEVESWGSCAEPLRELARFAVRRSE